MAMTYMFKTRLAEFTLEVEDEGQTLVINPVYCPKEKLSNISPEAIETGDAVHPFDGDGRQSNVPKSARRMLQQGAVCLLEYEGKYYYLGHWNKECEFIEHVIVDPVPAMDDWQDHDLYREPESDRDEDEEPEAFRSMDALKAAFVERGWDVDKAEALWRKLHPAAPSRSMCTIH